MKNTSLSLITALYNSENATDLYKEIYYPIIRYSVTEMYLNDEADASHYYALTQLQQVIIELFDIEIPTLILGHAVQLMGREYGITFEYYSDTTSFKIKEIKGDVSNTDVESFAHAIDSQLKGLEEKFQSFLEVENLDCERSFFDFFADSEKAIDCYLNHMEGLPNVNEEYVNLARFIQWTITDDNDTYVLIKRVLWGSVIAGFLQRKNDAIGINAINTVAYYIDTSLVFALLGYDTIDNVNYARELVREIVTSGAIPTVHALTREEINLIFESIEHQGAPDPTTAIGEAYYREKKHMSDLLHLKNTLYETLTKQYKINCPIESRDKIELYKRDFKNSKDVQMLKEIWNEKQNEDFREIHDVVLCTEVNKGNKYKTDIEHYNSYFVTRNSDLISMFGKRLSPAAIIHPGNVIMSLWIHSAQSQNIQQALLTEIITRCLAMNQTDAQRRLRVFEKYAKTAGLTEKDFKGMYTELIRRSAKTIQSSNIIIENESNTSISSDAQVELIKTIAIETSEAVYQRHLIQNEQKKIIDDLTNQKIQLEKEQAQNDETISMKEKLIQEYEDKKKSILQQNEQAKINQKKIACLYTMYGSALQEQKQMYIEREAYVTNTYFWFSYIAQWVMFLLIIAIIIYVLYNYIITGVIPCGITWAVLVPILTLIINFSLNHLRFPIFNRIDVGLARERERQIADWNKCNKNRIELVNENVESLKQQILELGGEV